MYDEENRTETKNLNENILNINSLPGLYNAHTVVAKKIISLAVRLLCSTL